jgi:hypothetical protein
MKNKNNVTIFEMLTVATIKTYFLKLQLVRTSKKLFITKSACYNKFKVTLEMLTRFFYVLHTYGVCV